MSDIFGNIGAFLVGAVAGIFGFIIAMIFLEDIGLFETRKDIDSLTGKTYWWSELTDPFDKEKAELPSLTMSFEGWKAIYDLVPKRFAINSGEILYDKDGDGNPELKITLQNKDQAKQYREWYNAKEKADYWKEIDEKIKAEEQAKREKEAADIATKMAFVEDIKEEVKVADQKGHEKIAAMQNKVRMERQAAIKRAAEMRNKAGTAQTSAVDDAASLKGWSYRNPKGTTLQP